MRPLRWIDAGRVSGVRSQALYHGLATAWTGTTPDTIVVATPADRYMCVGLHQDLEATVDTEWCRSEGIEVLRREAGGGAVLIDDGQVFVQWIMAPRSLPARIEPRFELFARPVIDTYAELGIEARFAPPNDIHVADRKICGTGAGRIGEAEVVVGNFLCDFDARTFARALRLSDAMRAEAVRSLERYMTTIRRELGSDPDRDRILATYRRQCGEALQRSVEQGTLCAAEEDAVVAAGLRLLSPEFRTSPGASARPGLKIHQGVRVEEREVIIDGASVPVAVTVVQDGIGMSPARPDCDGPRSP